MSKLEQVARALAEDKCGEALPDETWRQWAESFHEMSAKWPNYAKGRSLVTDAFREARVALEALRTPTPEMYEAFGADIDWDVFPGYWQRAIDAALKD